jgi:hypothetical protein
VSAAEKVKTVELGVAGPAERGGVAVMALGKIISRFAGDAGCAVKGVSGYLATYGVAILCLGFLASTGEDMLKDWRVLMAVRGVDLSMAVT